MEWKNRLALCDGAIQLVPYTPEYVSIYTQWLQTSHQLQLDTATDSEYLTLGHMQESQTEMWNDPTALRLIILCDGVPVGDVGVFKHSYLEDYTIEMDVMIAEPEYLRRGLAFSACSMLIQWVSTSECQKHFGVLKYIIAKISMDNTSSIALFTKLGFTVLSESAIFQELDMCLTLA